MADEDQAPSTAGGQLGPAEMLAVDARRVVLVGSMAFTVALAVLAVLAVVPLSTPLHVRHHHVWLWTCLAGAVLGFASLPLIARHRASGRLG